MKHFGIICPALSGHLNPVLPLGQELQRRGHRVTLFGIPDAQSRTIAAGVNFSAIGESEFPLGTIAQHFERQGKLNGLAAMRYFRKTNVATRIVTMYLREAPRAIKQAGVDALIVDQASLAGGTVADFLDIPFISFCAALLMNQEESVPPYITPLSYNPIWWARLRNRTAYGVLNRLTRPILEVIAEYRREWKLPPYSHSDDAYSQLAQMSQQPAEFEFPRQHLPQYFHFTGPYHNSATREPVAFPFEKLTRQPLIYASLGTIQNRMVEVFQKIAAACMGMDAQLVISLGGGMNSESLPKLPGKPLVVNYAPQLELLQKATLTITHAGLNTTLECLSNGVPLVAIPITSDQLGTGTRIKWTGTGKVVPVSRLSVSKLQTAIERVLTEESYRKNASRIQAAIRRTGGVSRAADIVEQAVSTGKSVLSHASS